jgi:hypothetical protein
MLVILLDCMKDAIAQQLLIQTQEAKNAKATAYGLKLMLPPALSSIMDSV